MRGWPGVELVAPIQSLLLCGSAEQPTDLGKIRERCHSLWRVLGRRGNRLGILQELQSAWEGRGWAGVESPGVELVAPIRTLLLCESAERPIDLVKIVGRCLSLWRDQGGRRKCLRI